MYEKYKDQVNLLTNILPYVTEESCFAMHGGTAINLFIREMPRLSVDIDLTYIFLEERESSIRNINNALARIKEKVENSIKQASVIHKKATGKLYVKAYKTEVKLEVNLTNRGTINDPMFLPLCSKAQSEYKVFLEVQVVPIGQLYGGKICAALDRQHPRDLFDVKVLLENSGLTDDIMEGFFYVS
jgi:predicted nucleotidyltransferase component of viral defense system